MFLFIRCPFCHRQVFFLFYAQHEREHTARRSDGQMTEHVTAPPEERFAGDLTGIPQGYVHSKCGVATGMPEEIIRTYLVNPLTYNDGSFCCGCGDYVSSSELVWTETGQNVMDYMGALRLKYVRDAFRMKLADRPEGLVITPRAVVKLLSVLQGARSQMPTVCLELIFESPTIHKLDLLTSLDEKTHVVVTIADVPIAVAKSDRHRLAGLMIHFQDTPQKGFLIVRLYAPN